MNLKNKWFCDWELVRMLQQKDLLKEEHSYATISITSEKNVEQMIFLGKSDDDSAFEVRVYKANHTDKYIPHALDNCQRFEENPEYISFFFERFKDARDFVYWLRHRHIEYLRRPLPTRK